MTDARFKGMKAVASAEYTSTLFGRLQFRWATYCFGKWRQLGEVWSLSGGKEVASLAGRRLRRWLGTRFGFVRSPSVLMGSILFSVAFTPDGQHIVSGSAEKLVKVWSVSARKQVASLAGHTFWVRSVAFSPDGQHIVSGSVDKLVKVWS
jgi:WD40 repeat protein